MRVMTVLPALLLPCMATFAGAQEPAKPGVVFAFSDYQRVEAEVFFMNPGQYIGKPVELRRMVCLPVAEKGFICSALNGRLAVLAPELTPVSEKKIVIERCIASDPLYRQRCTRTIRLVVGRVSGERGAEYSQQKLIIRAAMIEAVPLDLDSSDQ